ncbi:MAG: KH domain-containing protein, partial [Candidatus Riflebacteria bacterium]|nr:KH domain-containing protein [Candidatus Riflebacteria bacterium]
MQRVIEISAKSHEEAREIAKRELAPGERIAGEETLAAPARGIFGVVGNPEVKIRFTFEPAQAAAASNSANQLFNVEEDVIAPPPAEPGPYDNAAPRRPDASARPSSRPPVRSSSAGPARSAGRPERYPRGGDRPAPSNDRRPPRREEPVAEMGSFSDDDEKEYFNEDVSADSVSSTRDISTGPIGEAHPLHGLLMQVIRETAVSVGIADVTIQEKTENSHWVIDIRSADIALLIGKHGRTIDALQYLLNIIANKDREGRVKILLDAQGYRDQRQKDLIMLAGRMYRKVLDSGRQVELEPMSTIDRRTVHLALKDRQGVETFSRGTEPMRRVIITPRRGAGRQGPAARSDRDGAIPQKPSAAPRPASSPGRAIPVFMQE